MQRQRTSLPACVYRSLLHWTRERAHGPPFVVSAAEAAGALPLLSTSPFCVQQLTRGGGTHSGERCA